MIFVSVCVMVSNAREPSMRVNGALLPMYTGQRVVLVGTVAQVRTVVVAGRLISPHSLRLLLQVFIVILLEGRDMGNRERSEGERGKEREKQGRETE